MKTSVPVGQTTPSAEGGIDQSTEDFRIVWTLGFAGKRLLPDMEAARQALRAELQALVTAADQEGARLVAISSLAVGGDLLFAEECLRASIPFHAMLPFDPQEFLRDNFSSADAERFRRCVAGAYHLDVAAVDVDSIRSTEDSGAAKAQAENRRDAYLDAGYRIVENSDVMLFLWDGERSGRGGTADAWGYAETLKKPVWRWDPKAKTTERARWPGIAGQGRESKRLFHAHLLPELFAAAALLPTGEVVASDTPRQTAVRARFHQLDTLAVQEQTSTKSGLHRVLDFHLVAIVFAAATFTFFHKNEPSGWLLTTLFVLAVCGKPICAWLAVQSERQLHHEQHQDRWIDARLAAELLRSSVATWSLPTQPEKVFDIEDFPRFHRLIRSLVITRAIDQKEVLARWTLDRACSEYLVERVQDQQAFFEKKREAARQTHLFWEGVFWVATSYVLAVGLCFAYVHVGEHLLHFPGWRFKPWAENTLACGIIIAPFIATYALAIQTIHDTRRRLTRNEMMVHSLSKQRGSIERSRSAVAILRQIAATERMLAEELHEWDSVTRHVAV